MTGRTIQRPNVCTLGLVDRMRAAFRGRSPLTTAADIRAELHALAESKSAMDHSRDMLSSGRTRTVKRRRPPTWRLSLWPGALRT
jgi:hypothetical protein